MEDKPIVLKEGQAVILVPENNKSVMVGAAIVDGRLSIHEIDPHGRSFGVTWKDEESWQVSTMDSKDKVKTIILDTDGDGLPNLKTVMVEGSVTRYELADIQWRKLPSKAKGGEQPAPYDGDQPSN